MYQRRLIPPELGALKLKNELQYHGLAMCGNSAYDACISCENFVKFGSVIHMTSYSTLIETIRLSCTVFEL